MDPTRANATNQDLEHVREATETTGWTAVLTSIASPDRRAYDNATTRLSTAVAAIPSNETLVWEYLCEDDSAGTGFAQELLRRARDASYTNGRSRLTPASAGDAWTAYVARAYQATLPFRPDNIRRHARVGFPSNAHAVAPYADVVLVERANDDVGSYATSVPFVRGAARQFNVTWGVDLSLWYVRSTFVRRDVRTTMASYATARARAGGAFWTVAWDRRPCRDAFTSDCCTRRICPGPV